MEHVEKENTQSGIDWLFSAVLFVWWVCVDRFLGEKSRKDEDKSRKREKIEKQEKS